MRATVRDGIHLASAIIGMIICVAALESANRIFTFGGSIGDGTFGAVSSTIIDGIGFAGIVKFVIICITAVEMAGSIDTAGFPVGYITFDVVPATMRGTVGFTIVAIRMKICFAIIDDTVSSRCTARIAVGNSALRAVCAAVFKGVWLAVAVILMEPRVTTYFATAIFAEGRTVIHDAFHIVGSTVGGVILFTTIQINMKSFTAGFRNASAIHAGPRCPSIQICTIVAMSAAIFKGIVFAYFVHFMLIFRTLKQALIVFNMIKFLTRFQDAFTLFARSIFPSFYCHAILL